MPRRTLLCRRLLLAFGSAALAGPAFAQDTPGEQRIEITGSAIRRIDAETAVPVTVFTIDEMKKQGLTTVEQVLGNLVAMQTQQGTSQVVGAGTGGAAFADLRGIGPNKTLVLLNGRRIANNAIDSSAPDLNTIPFAALERVEVLRDGASALYGTDAIGGVINFITKKSQTGGVLTLGYDNPQHPGGNNANANIGYGWGDLDRDRFNVFGFVDFQRQDAVSGSDRSYGVNGKTSPTTFPGTYFQTGASANPAAPDCIGTYIKKSNATNCVYNPNLWIDYVPRSERVSGMLKGTLKLSEDHQLNLEYFATRAKIKATIAPVPYGALTVDPGTPFYPGNGITPAAPASVGLDTTQPITVRFRDEPNGGRQGETTNTQQRLVASIEGLLVGWDYQAGVAYNENKIDDRLVGGYTDGSIITAGVKDGTINPFGAQTAAGAALLQSAALTGQLQSAKGTVLSLDGRVGRDLGDWLGAGRPAAVAIGTEFRHENFKDIGNPPFDTLVIASTGFDPATDNEGSRNVFALYTELNLPILKSLEVTAAVRYDRYSDFGSTTNPKFSFRWQPLQPVLLRGAASTGFRAPSLFDLHAAQTYTNTPNTWDDPVRCPGGVVQPGLPEAANCGVQFMSLTGGNTELKPEKAHNATLGLLLEPMTGLSLGFDFWWVKVTQQINPIDDNTVFSDPVKYAGLFHRAPDGSLSTDGSQCPGANCGYVSLLTQNLGGVRSSGVDLSFNWKTKGDGGTYSYSLNSTYVSKYEYQTEDGGPWNENVGRYVGVGPIFRWQHALAANWSNDLFGLGAAGHYKSGYADQTAPNVVKPYWTADLYGAWQPLKAVSLTLGVRNLFDRNPPFSNQASTFQQGYDPRFADAVGRVYYIRGSYMF